MLPLNINHLFLKGWARNWDSRGVGWGGVIIKTYHMYVCM